MFALGVDECYGVIGELDYLSLTLPGHGLFVRSKPSGSWSICKE